jgi:hypothetical protein
LSYLEAFPNGERDEGRGKGGRHGITCKIGSSIERGVWRKGERDITKGNGEGARDTGN